MHAVIVMIVTLLVGLVLIVSLISKDLYDDIEVIKGDIDEFNDKLDRIISKLNKIAEK